jgi:hypothetical protein
VRKACSECCRKHLAQALVISHELQWYADNTDDNHFWVCVGHLAEAEAQIQRDSAYLADQIRQQRVLLIREGAGAVTKLNINLLINMVSEFAAATQQPSVLGVEAPDITEDFANGSNGK